MNLVFLHVSDLHIGKYIGDFDLIEDQRFILSRILSLAEEKHADALLIAGDIYDRAIPSDAAVALFDEFLSRTAKQGLKAFLISGNHDSDERLDFGSSLFRESGIFISGKYDGTLHIETVEDDYGPVRICLMPFLRASQVRHYYPDEEIATYDDAVRAVLRHTPLDPSVRNVLVAHQYVVAGSGAPELSGSESVGTQSVGQVEMIRADCFDAFDYVALGHIHTAQSVGRETVRYAGSPLKYSQSEVNSVKYATVVTLGEKGDVGIELAPLTPLRDMRQLKGRMDQLLDEENLTGQDDFIFVTLTDENPVEQAIGIFQRYYPRTVKLNYDNSWTRELEQAVEAPDSRDKSFDELISEFYRMIYGTEISADERKMMRQAAEKAGVIHEAG